jgi:hypothetical protein
MSITFTQRGKGHMTGWTRKTDDKIDVRKVGSAWVLTILEEATNLPLHTFNAARQYECCQEACRYFRVGAYGDPNSANYIPA